MSNESTLADGRDGEAMGLTTSLFRNEPMHLGIPESLLPEIKAAAKGDAAALLTLGRKALASEGLFGTLPMLALAEVVATFAALNGGVEERAFYAAVIERQAEAFKDKAIQRRVCLWQLASIHEARAGAGTEGARADTARILSLLADEGDNEAAAALSKWAN